MSNLNLLVKKNEELILKFISKNTNSSDKYYEIKSSLNALDINNNIQEFFIDTLLDNRTTNEMLLRLYAIFQGLFVSIDSLYSLANHITRSKTFININQNEVLRTLKFIRNDVVGHPNNRVYNDNTIGYCILDKKKVFNDRFTYRVITSTNEEIIKDVDIVDVLNNYYDEANLLLERLMIFKSISLKDTFTFYAHKVYDLFIKKGNYLKELDKLREVFLKTYNDDTNRNRLIWRIDLIKRLNKLSNDYTLGLLDYSIMYEIIKINELCNDIDEISVIKLDMGLKTPKTLSSVYRFLNNNPNLVNNILYLYNEPNPLFLATINKFKQEAQRQNVKEVVSYLDLLKELYNNNEIDLLYAFSVLLKLYKR